MIPRSLLGKISATLAVAFIFIPFLFIGKTEMFQNLEYFGFFLASYFGAAGYVLLPVFLKFLNPIILIIVGAFGLSIDEFFAWYAGKTSKHDSHADHKLHERIKRFIERRGVFGIFCLGLLPFPGVVYAISGFTAGHFRIPFIKYYLANFSGKLIRTALVVTVLSLVM